MKDFANSYEQLCWKNACTSYARWLPFTNSEYESIRKRAQEQIDRLVKEYPQLVKSN